MKEVTCLMSIAFNDPFHQMEFSDYLRRIFLVGGFKPQCDWNFGPRTTVLKAQGWITAYDFLYVDNVRTLVCCSRLFPAQANMCHMKF
jgi:hypothetical protein